MPGSGAASSHSSTALLSRSTATMARMPRRRRAAGANANPRVLALVLTTVASSNSSAAVTHSHRTVDYPDAEVSMSIFGVHTGDYLVCWVAFQLNLTLGSQCTGVHVHTLRISPPGMATR